jgi:prolycopene isomerase
MMILGMLAAGQLGRVAGSPEDLFVKMEGRLVSLGGSVRYRAPVASVRVEEGRAVGVELEDGTFQPAHAVVSTIDSAQLLGRLLPPSVKDPITRERLETWPTSTPAAFVNFITSGAWDDAPWYTQARLAEPIVTGAVKGERINVRFFNPGAAGAGPGEQAVELSVDSDLAWWDAPPETLAARRGSLVREATARMEGLFPGFSGRVLHAESVTPDVFVRAVRAPKGVTNAYIPTPKAASAESPRTVPGIKGLYLAGQWAIAGAGVLAVLYSGRHAVQILCRDDGRRFVAHQ